MMSFTTKLCLLLAPKRGNSIKILIRKVFFKVEINYHNVETTT